MALPHWLKHPRRQHILVEGTRAALHRARQSHGGERGIPSVLVPRSGAFTSRVMSIWTWARLSLSSSTRSSKPLTRSDTCRRQRSFVGLGALGLGSPWARARCPSAMFSRAAVLPFPCLPPCTLRAPSRRCRSWAVHQHGTRIRNRSATNGGVDRKGRRGYRRAKPVRKVMLDQPSVVHGGSPEARTRGLRTY